MSHKLAEPTEDFLSSRAPTISLVLPAWNEADSIERAIHEADVALASIASRYEIIVVDDGSVDETSDRVTAISLVNSAVRLIKHGQNYGYGAALRSGFDAARFELIAFTDADCQFDLTELDRFVLLSQDYDIVCGYRIDRKDPLLRCVYSRVYNQLVRLLLNTGVRDVDCALKVFRRETLVEARISENGFLVNAEVISRARREGRSIVEVGVSHRPREAGESTVSIGHVPRVLASLLRHWWNQVQFSPVEYRESGNQSRHSEQSITDTRYRFAQFILVLIAAVLLLSNLNYPLIDRDETRYGEIPREMLETGEWVLPQLNFRPYYDKPVLLYWLCAGSYSIFGVSPGAARVVPALCGMGTLLISIWFANRIFGFRAGFLGGLSLLLSVGFLGGSRILLLDGLLTFLTTISLVAGYESLRADRVNWKWWTIAALAAGFGFLTKGPVAVVLVVPPLFLQCWLAKGTTQLEIRHWLFFSVLVAVVNIPWFVAVSQRDPTFVFEFFYRHNVQRFAGAFHAEPFWYFLPILLIAGHPWTFMAIPYATFLLSSQKEARRIRPLSLGFLLLWSTWCVAFFSASSCKLPTYILPAAPALALMIGHYLDQVVFARVKLLGAEFSRYSSPWLATLATCLGGIGFVGFGLWAGLESPLTATLIISVSILLAAGATYAMRSWPIASVQWSLCVIGSFLLTTLVLHREMPRFATAETIFGVGSPLASSFSDTAPVVTIGHEWASVPFDLDRDDVKNFDEDATNAIFAYTAQHEEVLIIFRPEQNIDDLRKMLPSEMRVAKVDDRGPAKIVLFEKKPSSEVRVGSTDKKAPRKIR